MAITSLMSVIMVMAMHTCYLACKKRVDTAIIAKPDISRMPVIQDQNLTTIREQHIVGLRGQMIRPPILRENPKAASAPIQKNNDKDNYIEMKTPVSENWVQCQYNWLLCCARAMNVWEQLIRTGLTLLQGKNEDDWMLIITIVCRIVSNDKNLSRGVRKWHNRPFISH